MGQGKCVSPEANMAKIHCIGSVHMLVQYSAALNVLGAYF